MDDGTWPSLPPTDMHQRQRLQGVWTSPRVQPSPHEVVGNHTNRLPPPPVSPPPPPPEAQEFVCEHEQSLSQRLSLSALVNRFQVPEEPVIEASAESSVGQPTESIAPDEQRLASTVLMDAGPETATTNSSSDVEPEPEEDSCRTAEYAPCGVTSECRLDYNAVASPTSESMYYASCCEWARSPQWHCSHPMPPWSGPWPAYYPPVTPLFAPMPPGPMVVAVPYVQNQGCAQGQCHYHVASNGCVGTQFQPQPPVTALPPMRQPPPPPPQVERSNVHQATATASSAMIGRVRKDVNSQTKSCLDGVTAEDWEALGDKRQRGVPSRRQVPDRAFRRVVVETLQSRGPCVPSEAARSRLAPAIVEAPLAEIQCGFSWAEEPFL